MPPSGGTVLKFAGVAPRVASSAALSGTVIGRTVVGDRTTIGHGAVLRGDVNDISIGDGVHIEPGVVVHVAKHNPAGNSLATTVGSGSRIGCGAVLHACTVQENACVGPGTHVMRSQLDSITEWYRT
ncbi:Gamma carbonic anhydrase family protein [Plasmodiophora brassicae]